jgi:DNA polymerase I-like protein with 3'-5' exonuclease and polymerase domains
MVLDEETETHSKYKRKANPFLDDNWIVMRGWKMQGDPRCTMEHYPTQEEMRPLHIPEDCTLIVAHNAKFELLYEKRFSADALHQFFKRGGRIWCTQYAEYLLRGQQQKYQMCALDAIVESYGGRKKIDGIKELWDAGVKTSEIDPELLEDYLIGTEEEGRNSGDIGNTELVFLGQVKEAVEANMMEAIKVRMDGLCATSEMEFNGIKVDTARAKIDLARLTAEWTDVGQQLEQYIPELPEGLTFNWNSGVHKSALLFGGTIRYKKSDTYLDEKTGELARLKATEKWPLFGGDPMSPEECIEDPCTGLCDYGGQLQDTFKSGKKIGEGKFKNVDVPGELKTKIQDFFFEMPGYTAPEDDWRLDTKDGADKRIYGTGSEIIELLANRDVPFLKTMGRYQALTKEIGTYYVRYDEKKREYVGMLTCVHPENHVVHHKLNHTSTVTTRLSSSDPNFQNLPRGDKSQVKAMMISRFTEAYCAARGIPVSYDENGMARVGVVGELDYSQLEVVVQGLLTNDTNLVRDICSGIDFHCKRVSLQYGCTYDEALYWCKDEGYQEYHLWKPRRTGCKIFSFQRAYGAGASLIALSTGMPLDDVKALIIAEDKEYPGVPKFNDAVAREVDLTAEPFRDPDRGWRVFRRGTWQAPTGTIYSWRSWDAPSFLKSKGITDTFSPTELKNYPVQGTGGEIVQMVLGYLWRWFVSTDNFNNRALLTNTVHDCVWVDMHPDVVDLVMPGMKKIMEAVPQMLKRHFGMECPVPFPVDAETGPNMFDLHHYEPKAA